MKNDILDRDIDAFHFSRIKHEEILRDFIQEVLEARQERISQTGSSCYTNREVFMVHLASILLPEKQCRVVLDYDPAKERIQFFREYPQP